MMRFSQSHVCASPDTARGHRHSGTRAPTGPAATAAGASAAVASRPSDPLTLATRTGQLTLQRPALQHAPLRAPPGADIALMQPVLDVAAVLIHTLPASSEAKIRGAAARYRRALTFWALREPSELASVAYVVARCCPPVGVPVPDVCRTPVAPSTAAGDVDALARACELELDGFSRALAPAFQGPMVRGLLKAIGARVRRLRTNKRALLFTQVEAAWSKAEGVGSPTAIRDGFAIVVAFFYGLRISELLALRPEHIDPVSLADGAVGMQVTFVQCKNRRSTLMQHQPFKVTCAHPLLVRAWAAFERRLDYYDNTPVFHRLSGSSRDPLSRSWFATVIREAAPGTTPHSARVGLATELWAAGKSLDVIMAAGRWTSPAAVLYVIGSLEDQVAATRDIGSAHLAYSGDDLRRMGMSPSQFAARHHAPSTDSKQWAAIAAVAEAE